MMPSLKAECRKLLTIRSSYVVPAIAYAFLVFILLYVMGYRNGLANTTGPAAKFFLANSLPQAANIMSVFGGIVGLLLITHEYRYNTIMYSLTLTNNRLKVLVSKVIAVFGYALLFTLIGDVIALVSMLIGAHLAGATIPHQDLSLWTYAVKSVVFCEGWALAGLLFGTLLRNQVGALAVLLIVPGTVEALLGLLLKENTKYLPFTALSQVLSNPSAGLPNPLIPHPLPPVQGGLLFLAYLVVGWLVAGVLFLRRDAN